METSTGSAIWCLLQAERGNWFDQDCKESWWQGGEGAEAGRAGKDGLFLVTNGEETLMLVLLQRAKHIISLNGFSDIRNEENAPQRGSVVGSTMCSIHQSLLQAFAANLLRDAEAP